MAIDRRYIPAFSLDNVFRDKDTGEPLANGTLEFFINNTSIQKDVIKLLELRQITRLRHCLTP